MGCGVSDTGVQNFKRVNAQKGLWAHLAALFLLFMVFEFFFPLVPTWKLWKKSCLNKLKFWEVSEKHRSSICWKFQKNLSNELIGLFVYFPFKILKKYVSKNWAPERFFFIEKKSERFGWFLTLKIYFEGQILALFDKAVKLCKTFRNAYNRWGWLTLQDLWMTGLLMVLLPTLKTLIPPLQIHKPIQRMFFTANLE